ncbi:mitochondrial nuclease, partial [Colletotrichum chrysophilum]
MLGTSAAEAPHELLLPIGGPGEPAMSKATSIALVAALGAGGGAAVTAAMYGLRSKQPATDAPMTAAPSTNAFTTAPTVP